MAARVATEDRRDAAPVARLAGIDQGGLSRIERGLGAALGPALARILVVLDWLSGGGDPAGPWADARGVRPDRLPHDAGPGRRRSSVFDPGHDDERQP